MKTKKLTVAQAILAFLEKQYTERDGKEQRFFAGCAGIFGHGNLAGFGQALHQNPEFPYIMVRNEQAAVHMGAGFNVDQGGNFRINGRLEFNWWWDPEAARLLDCAS